MKRWLINFDHELLGMLLRGYRSETDSIASEYFCVEMLLERGRICESLARICAKYFVKNHNCNLLD